MVDDTHRNQQSQVHTSVETFQSLFNEGHFLTLRKHCVEELFREPGRMIAVLTAVTHLPCPNSNLGEIGRLDENPGK